MAQLSRPYQIGLAVVAVFAAVFLLAFHGHSSTSSSTSAPAAPATITSTTASSPAPAGGGSTGSAAEQAALSHSTYHGSAPGVGGLSRAIAKAHGAAAISEQTNAHLAQKSEQASSTSPGTSGAPATTTTHVSATATVVHTTTQGATTRTSTVHAAVKPSPAHSTSAAGAANLAAGPAGQRAVEAELAQGKIVVLLFWNPRGTDDRLVHHELKLMLALHRNAKFAKAEAVRHAGRFFGRNFDNSIAVHETLGSSVAAYGSITRGVQVYGTPTLLVIGGKGQTITETGVIDAYGIEQAIYEAHTS